MHATVLYNFNYRRTANDLLKVNAAKSFEDESIMTVSRIVEQKEVFEKRFKYRKDQTESSYEESTFTSSEEVRRKVVRYSPAAAHQVSCLKRFESCLQHKQVGMKKVHKLILGVV